jgi:RNA 2',3'-cyclic 3'-phosphodiesterase
VNFSGMGGTAAGVYWAAIEPCPALEKLAADIDHCLQPLGIAGENRPFHPHVTVARFKDRKILRQLDGLVHENSIHGHGRCPKWDFESISAREFHLMESTTLPTGPIYSKVRSFPFASTGT